MEKILKDMLQGTLIVPFEDFILKDLSEVCQDYVKRDDFFDEDFILKDLSEVCQDYVKRDDFFDEDFNNLVNVLLTNSQQNSLCKILEQDYKSKTDNDIRLPKCTQTALIVFILFAAVHDSEADDEIKAIYSAMLMNYMILRKGTFSTLPFKKYLIQLYGHFDTYWTIFNNSNEKNESVLLRKLLTEQEFIENEGLSEDELVELQDIAKDAAKYRINRLMKSTELINIKNSFERAYIGLNMFFDKLPWLYLDIKIEDLLTALFPEQNEETNKLKDILEYIQNIENYTSPEFISKSSILLRLLNNDSELENILILDKEFTPKEFCVYLYYELMLEKKLKDYNNDEGE